MSVRHHFQRIFKQCSILEYKSTVRSHLVKRRNYYDNTMFQFPKAPIAITTKRFIYLFVTTIDKDQFNRMSNIDCDRTVFLQYNPTKNMTMKLLYYYFYNIFATVQILMHTLIMYLGQGYGFDS